MSTRREMGEPWFCGFCLGASATYGCMRWATAVSYRRAFKARPSYSITIEIDEEACRYSGDGLSSVMKWSALGSLWRTSDMWFLILKYSRRPLTIPIEGEQR